MTQLKILSTEDKLAEIRRLYFNAARGSIEQDLAKALDLLRSMASDEERERAAVYMEGLAEMRNDWLRESKPKPAGTRGGGARKNASGDRAKQPRKDAKKPVTRR